MKIKTVALTAMILALVVSNGCGPQTAESPETGSAPPVEEEIWLGFLVKMPEELWFQNEWKFAQQCADKYGFELIKIGVPDGENDQTLVGVLA